MFSIIKKVRQYYNVWSIGCRNTDKIQIYINFAFKIDKNPVLAVL